MNLESLVKGLITRHPDAYRLVPNDSNTYRCHTNRYMLSQYITRRRPLLLSTECNATDLMKTTVGYSDTKEEWMESHIEVPIKYFYEVGTYFVLLLQL